MENITDANFEEELKKAGQLVLADFFAEWCGPCSVLGPIIEKVAEQFKDKITLLKINLDSIPATAQKLGIDRIPIVIVFKEGKPIDGFIGVRAEKDIIDWLSKIIR